MLRARRVGRHNSTRVDGGRKGWRLLAIKMQGTNRGGEGPEEPALRDPGFELRLGGRHNRRAKIIDGMKKKKNVKGRDERAWGRQNRVPNAEDDGKCNNACFG